MSYVMGQVPVPGPGTVPLFTVPPGWCNVTFYNISTAAVFIGTSTALTSGNGLQCHSIPTSVSGYIASKGATFYGCNTASSTTAVVNYIISTDS